VEEIYKLGHRNDDEVDEGCLELEEIPTRTQATFPPKVQLCKFIVKILSFPI